MVEDVVVNVMHIFKFSEIEINPDFLTGFKSNECVVQGSVRLLN